MKLTDILLLELAGAVALHEGGLSDTSVTNKDKLELNRSGLKRKRERRKKNKS